MAHYRLNRIRETYGRPEFIYELNCFLSAIRSIPEYLLEEYNVKYSLNIPDKDFLSQKFKKVAKEKNNKQAIKFFEWWSAEDKRLREDDIGKLVLSKRDISIHRRTIRPDRGEVEPTEHVRVIRSIRIEKRDAEGRLIETFELPRPSVPIKEPPEEAEVKTDWFFKDHPDENVLEVCEKIYEMMIKLVEAAHLKFP